MGPTSGGWRRWTNLTLPTSNTLVDDRLLVAYVTGAAVLKDHAATHLNTTTYWYYRACRASVLGGAGQLSGPFVALEAPEQAAAIQAMLALPDEIGLPDPRELVPAMADVASRHRRLNLMNVEATAAAQIIGAVVVLSPAASEGVLPAVLEAEHIGWSTAPIG